MVLFAKNNTPTSQARPAAESDSCNLKSREKIGFILKQLADGRHLATVTLNTGREPIKATSTIIKIDPSRAMLYLDELIPENTNDILSRLKSCRIDTALQCVPIAFDSDWVGSGRKDGILFHGLRFPSGLHYDQRRAYYRVSVPLMYQVPLQLLRADGTLVDGRLRDISQGGIMAELKKAPPDLFRIGDPIPNAHIHLPEEHEFQAALEVRSFTQRTRDKKRFLGARFQDMTMEDSRRVEQFIAKLEREKIRCVR